LNLLTTGKVWWTLVVLLIIASTAKIVPVTLASKLFTKKPWHYCLSIGVLMNTRGIVQLVVLNIGVELKVISPIIFALFVLMATILTFITSPVLYLLYRRGLDREKLSVPNVAEDLRLVRETDISMSELTDTIPTISDGEMGTNEMRRNGSKASKLSATTSMPGVGAVLTIDERFNYPEVDPDGNMEQPAVIANIVTMPTCPTRQIYMTRF
jgi:hypothetical protein